MSAEVNLEELVQQLEGELGVPAGFFSNLLKEDDWSFVIKLHALFEGAVTHLLEHALGRTNLRPILAHLELSDTRTGKLAFARALGVLDEDERRFVSMLSQLRNQLVHDVRKVVFSFGQHVESLDKNQRDSFMKVFAFYFSGSVDAAGKEVKREDFVRSNPKLAVYLVSMGVLANIYQHKEIARLRSELNDVLVNAYAKRPG